MDPVKRPRLRLLAAEPLEGRWLLSGIGPAPADVGGIEVVEIGAVADDRGVNIPLAPSRLSEKVVAALDARFPGAKVLAAEYSVEDGEFGLTAELNGRVVGVAITPRGDVVETETVIGSARVRP